MLYIDAQPNSVIPQYIKLADIGIIPLLRLKWWEVSSPLKLMEYLSMEIPIVLSDIKAHLDVLPAESDFVVYFNPDKKEDLADKILLAYGNYENLKKNSWNGRKIILENYSWDKIAEKLLTFFQKFDERTAGNASTGLSRAETKKSIYKLF